MSNCIKCKREYCEEAMIHNHQDENGDQHLCLVCQLDPRFHLSEHLEKANIITNHLCHPIDLTVADDYEIISYQLFKDPTYPKDSEMKYAEKVLLDVIDIAERHCEYRKKSGKSDLRKIFPRIFKHSI